jgi:hypothetical protein
MKRCVRILGAALCVLGLAACAASSTAGQQANAPQQTNECSKGGASCRWDGQCCSGRCYVDTGCSG